LITKSRNRRFTAGVAAVALLLLLLPSGRPLQGQEPQETPRPPAPASPLDGVQKRGEELLRASKTVTATIGIEHALGPIAPVAISPYFGLACLSGLSLLGNHVHWLPSNDFLTKNPTLNNIYVFIAFLALAVLTSLPRMTKVSNTFGTALGYLEDHAALVCIAVIELVPLIQSQFQGGAPHAAQEPVIIQAGVFSFSLGTLVFIAALVNYFVIATVRFLFDVLVFLSPFPLVDALLEVGKKTVSAGLLALYAFSPALALVVNLSLFLIALLFFGKALRLGQYYKSILIGPVLHGVLKALFGVRDPGPLATPLPMRLRDDYPGLRLALPVFTLQRAGRVKPRTRCFLLVNDEGIFFVRSGLFHEPQRLGPGAGRKSCRIGKDLTYIAISAVDAESGSSMSFALSNRYAALYDRIREILEAEDLGAVGALKALRESGRKLKDGLGFMGRAIRGGRVAKKDW
jgi:hypothetical protein